MDLKQFFCPRCGLASVFVASILAASSSIHSRAVSHDATTNPNCPSCGKQLTEWPVPAQPEEEHTRQPKAEESAEQANTGDAQSGTPALSREPVPVKTEQPQPETQPA